ACVVHLRNVAKPACVRYPRKHRNTVRNATRKATRYALRRVVAAARGAGVSGIFTDEGRGLRLVYCNGRIHHPMQTVTLPATATPAASPATTVVVRKPYLLFLGEATHFSQAKTAFGLRDWAPEACVGQWRLPGCAVTLDLPDLEPAQAVTQGAGSLLIG